MDSPAEKILKASENLKNGMAELAKIDPIALNHLLNQNAELTKSLEQAMAAYSKYRAKDGIIILEGQELLLRFKNVVGQLTIDVNIDDESNIVLKNVHTASANSFSFWPNVGPGDPVLCAFNPSACQQTAEAYRAAAMKAFSDYLASTTFIPAPGISDKYLNENLRGVGIHHILVRAVPQKLVGINWSITGELLLRMPDKTERSLKEFTLDTHAPATVDVLIEVKSRGPEQRM